MKNDIINKLLKILIMIIFSPLILMVMIIGLVILFFDQLKEPSRKKEYKNSYYFHDFQVPYHRGILYEDSYQFYNEAKEANLDVPMIHPFNNCPDYILFQDKAMLFPMGNDIFDGIFYHDMDHEWKVILDGEWFSLDEEWEKHQSNVQHSIQVCHVF